MMRKIVGPKALKLAKVHCPQIIHYYESPFDIPCEFNFGGFQPVSKPTIYYAVRVDNNYYYILYGIYHYQDWAKGITKPFDEHRHDFEGILVRTLFKPSYFKKSATYDVITVSHDTMPVRWQAPQNFYATVESQGHAIKPFHLQWKKNFMVLKSWTFISMDQFSTAEWNSIKANFNQHGVSLPDQWNDVKLALKFGKDQTKGLMWKNPARLFKLMAELNPPD
jgi:hypothetical protein